MLDEIYYTPEELSKRFKLSLSTIYNLIEKGELPSIKLGKCYRIPQKGLARTLAMQGEGLPSSVDEFLRGMKCLDITDDILDIILYGSYARGDYDRDSDIDVLVIVRKPDNVLYDSISEISDAAMAASGYGDFLSVIQMSKEQWDEAAGLKTPFYNAVAREGISLWKKI